MINIPPGPARRSTAGFLALPTNSGAFERNRFILIPEATLNLTYHHTPCLSFHVGYNIIWMTESVISRRPDRPDAQSHATSRPAGRPGPPGLPVPRRDYWLQGINFGMNLDF